MKDGEQDVVGMITKLPPNLKFHMEAAESEGMIQALLRRRIDVTVIHLSRKSKPTLKN
jgi:hypothetical protein